MIDLIPTWTSIRRGLQQCCPRNQTPTTEIWLSTRPANAQRQHPQSGTKMDTNWKKEARTAKDDMATEVMDELKETGLSWGEAQASAKDRTLWRNIVVALCPTGDEEDK